MKLVIIGLGYSAGFVARAAQARGYEVFGTVRDAERAGEISRAGIPACVFGGFAVASRLAQEIASADALLVSVPPGDDGDPALNALGPLIAGAPRLNWIGYFSTTGVYGDHAGGWVDEATSTEAARPSSQRRVAVERDWLALGERTGKAVTIFRLSGIYGPGRNAIRNLRAGTARRLIKPGQFFSRIHVEDIAGIVLAALARPRAGAIYNLADDEPAPPQDPVTFAAGLIGVEPPPEEPFDPATLKPMAAAFYAESRRVSNALVKRELDYRLRYPTYREALTALARTE